MGQEAKASVKHWYHHTARHFLGLDHTHLSLTVSGTTVPLYTTAVPAVVQSSYKGTALVLYLSSRKGHFTGKTLHEPNEAK